MSELIPYKSKSYITQVLGDTFVQWGARIGMIWVFSVVFFATWAPVLVNSMPYAVKFKDQRGWQSPFLSTLTTYDAMMFIIFFAVLVLFIYRKVGWAGRVGFVAWCALTGFILTFWAPVADMLLSANPDRYGFLKEALGYGYSVGISAVLYLVMLGAAAGIFFGLIKESPLKPRLIMFVIWALLLLPWVLSPVNPPRTIVWEEFRVAEKNGEVEQIFRAPIPYSPWDNGDDNYEVNRKPSSEHWLGTDNKNVDVAGRMIYGNRIALSVGFISTAISLLIGITIGGIMGYFAGWVDLFGMRLVEIFSSIPALFLILAFIAFYGKNLYMVMLIIGVVGWPGYAIYIRAEYLKMRKMEYVQAANALGLPLRSVLFKHMLPNGIAPTLVSATFGFASAVSTESVLSFLSLVDAPSWGQLLSQAIAEEGGFYMWIAFPPGLAIFFTVFSYNLIGESLRDAIDPRIAKKRG